MKASQGFPTVIILLSLAASLGNALDGDWRRVVYWFAAAVLNAAVTF